MTKNIFALAILATLGASFVSTPSVSAEKIMTFGNSSSSVDSSLCTESSLKELTSVIRVEADKAITSEFSKNPTVLQSFNSDPRVAKLMSKMMKNQKINSGMNLMIEGALEETLCNPEINTTKMTSDQILSMYKKTNNSGAVAQPFTMVRL
jgi:hypothetical protein